MRSAIALLIALNACNQAAFPAVAVENVNLSARQLDLVKDAGREWLGTCGLGVLADVGPYKLTVDSRDEIDNTNQILGQASGINAHEAVMHLRNDMDDKRLYRVALHEWGHVFGLDHSEGGLMAPLYNDDTDVKPYCGKAGL